MPNTAMFQPLAVSVLGLFQTLLIF